MKFFGNWKFDWSDCLIPHQESDSIRRRKLSSFQSSHCLNWMPCVILWTTYYMAGRDRHRRSVNFTSLWCFLFPFCGVNGHFRFSVIVNRFVCVWWEWFLVLCATNCGNCASDLGHVVCVLWFYAIMEDRFHWEATCVTRNLWWNAEGNKKPYLIVSRLLESALIIGAY
jgi:hypothetical protein